jgi:glucose-6-phosphate isomerase
VEEEVLTLSQAAGDTRVPSDGATLWQRYRDLRYEAPGGHIAVDVSSVRFEDGYLERMAPATRAAMDALAALEAGSLANADEGCRVGHYWLRAPQLAPEPAIAREISAALESVASFARAVRDGILRGTDGRFEHVLHVGIGGSALGPEMVCEALAATSPLEVHFLDNADPDGVERVMETLAGRLGRTLVSVVSKSGVTPTPRHVLTAVRAGYRKQGLEFAQHAVATTMVGTELDRAAQRERWLARFPLWDWVGGRTSVTSAVGLLPLALRGVDIREFLDGAADMDRLTRDRRTRSNPAALMALMWHWLGDGRGSKRMVVLPYKDRLIVFPRYVQQLAMESLGKRCDRDGAVVHQGLTVYGNKGTTDQHAYVQQLRDGTADFFATFIVVHGEHRSPPLYVEPGVTLGDHLFGGFEATRNALYERGRDSITITLRDLSARSVGALIALFERAVGLYAELIGVNAYDQPGVDKHAADAVIELQLAALAQLRRSSEPATADEIASAIGRGEQAETIYRVLNHLAHDGSGRVAITRAGRDVGRTRFAGADA